MRKFFLLALFGLIACGCSSPGLGDAGSDGGAVDAGLVDAGLVDAGLVDAGADEVDSGCYVPPVPGGTWATGSCPDAGCPAGSFCLLGQGESSSTFGCVPIAAACDGGPPSCACMGCVCAIACYDTANGPICDNGTISQRAAKKDITYLSSEERRAVAHDVLQIRAASYRYKTDPQDGRRRLGFLIDDQPNPSPAVRDDRMHVDEYGYTSMLLVTVQEQAREIAELRRRLELLERRSQR